MMRRSALRWLVALALPLAVASPAVAQELEVGGGGDNTAVVVNTHDGQSRFRISFKIVRTSSDVVDNGNAAVAFSSCEGCSSVAVAFQVVLVSSDPSVVTPTNLAIAMNFECTDCNTLASAYQWVLGTDGRVRFTPEGNQALAEIRRQLRQVLHSDQTIEEIQASLDRLAEDLEQILMDELAAAGPPDASAERVPEADTGESPQPGPTPEPSGTSSSPAPDAASTPTPSPSPSQSPTSDAGSSPSPETTATPTPSPTAAPTTSPAP